MACNTEDLFIVIAYAFLMTMLCHAFLSWFLAAAAAATDDAEIGSIAVMDSLHDEECKMLSS